MQLQQVLQIQQPDPQATAAEAPMPSWLATEEYLPNPSPMLNLPPWKDAALRDKAPTPSPAFEEAQELNQMELEDPSPHQPTRETPLPTLRSSMDRQSTEHWTRMSCSNEELDTQMSIPGKNQARAVSRASNSPSGDEEIAGPSRDPLTASFDDFSMHPDSYEGLQQRHEEIHEEMSEIDASSPTRGSPTRERQSPRLFGLRGASPPLKKRTTSISEADQRFSWSVDTAEADKKKVKRRPSQWGHGRA
ncbi:hypothetical protein CYMTET_55781 [Cymbomonas tetramitiformis]|uniref:Uncharacterized protein n=1 Tax=Cymbomonas tetramitiformis TaxID=36881 RepID=A0AAE0EN86_9CHLO|nr:hypothetical protein CYMTET_55781 [Cymbomonas tetramitiformis]